MQQQPENKLNNKYRWKELTYKLIYPAFFGNMVYDFITFFSDLKSYDWLLITSTGLILLFYILDYVHLNVDLENLVPEEKKDIIYMAADIGVSLLLFLSVAFVKFHLPEVSVYLLCFVPVLFATYNIKLGYHPNFHKWYRRIALIILGVFAGLQFYFYHTTSYDLFTKCFLFGTSVILTTLYLIYNLNNFWIPSKLANK